MVVVLTLAKVDISPILEDLALRLLFLNAGLNPVLYGVCRNNYRKGYRYIVTEMLHAVSCGLLPRPTEEMLFYDSRRRTIKRHREAAAMEIRLSQKKRRMSAIQMLQQTLQRAQPSSPLEKKESSEPEFIPSKRLQALFERYMETGTESSASSSSIDYDFLAMEYVDDDIELDIDYDTLIDADVGDVFMPLGSSKVHDNSTCHSSLTLLNSWPTGSFPSEKQSSEEQDQRHLSV